MVWNHTRWQRGFQKSAVRLPQDQKNMSFALEKNYRGDILIHAGKSVDKRAMEKFKIYGLECPVGCIIAKATLAECREVNDEVKDELRKKNTFVYSGTIENLEWKGYGFKLKDIQKIEQIPADGKLSLWEYDYKE